MIAIFNKKTPSFHYINCNYQGRTAIFMGILHVEIGLYIETMPWAIWKNLFSYTCHIDLKGSSTYSQIAKIIVSTVIRYRSNTEVSGRFLFDVDTRIFAILVTSYLCQTAKHNHNMLQSHCHHLERSLGRDDGKNTDSLDGYEFTVKDKGNKFRKHPNPYVWHE